MDQITASPAPGTPQPYASPEPCRCGACLWLWPGLKGEPPGPHRCYNGQCRHYHQQRAGHDKACPGYEARPEMTTWAERWRKRRQPRTPSPLALPPPGSHA